VSSGWLRWLAARLEGAVGLGPGTLRHDDDPAYRRLLSAAARAHPGDPELQLAYVRRHGTRQHVLLALCEIAQYQAHHLPFDGAPFAVNDAQLDCLWRALLDLARHLQPDLPDGVYGYMLDNLEPFGQAVFEHTAIERARRERRARVWGEARR
jgi:hypothetical protein